MISELNIGRIFAATQFLFIGCVLLFSYLFRDITHINIKIIGAFIVILGIGIGLLALKEFNQKITPNPIPLNSASLKVTGIYGLIRHPMYLSVIISIIGWLIYFLSFFSILFIILLIIFFVIKINFEEKHLIQKFPEYRNYQNSSFKLIPYIY